MMEMKNDRRAQSEPMEKICNQTTSSIDARNINSRDNELNALNVKDQENRMQDVPFRSSEISELRTPVHPVINLECYLDDSYNERGSNRGGIPYATNWYYLQDGK